MPGSGRGEGQWIDPRLACDHAGRCAVVAEVGDAAPAGLGVERACGFALGGPDFAADGGCAMDGDHGQTFAQLGFVFHAGRYLLADVTAFAEIHAIEALEPGL